MLHYNPRHVSGNTTLIVRRTDCITAASGIVTLQTAIRCAGTLYGRLQRVTIPDAVIIQFDLLKMRMVLLETCQGL